MFTVFLLPFSAKSEEARKILILHSYEQLNGWTDKIMDGMVSALKPADNNISIYTEYLDARRFSKTDFWPAFERYLEAKYRGEKFDVILASDDDILDFLIPRYEDLFPGIPIVFCGINNLDVSKFEKHIRFKGINQEVDAKATIELALKLLPHTEKFLVISDRTSGGIKTTAKFKKDIKELGLLEREFLLIDDYTMSELKKHIQALGPNDVVLVLRIQQIKGIDERDPVRFTKIVADIASVPVFKLAEIRNVDTIGGVYVSPFAQGKTAAEIGLRILGGESLQNIPQVTKSPNVPTLNYAEIKRFGINEEYIPEGVLITKPPVTFLEQYRYQIYLTLLFVVALLFIIIALIFVIAFRKKAETQIKASLKEKETLLNEIHHRVKNNMQIIASLLNLQLNRKDEQTVESVIKESKGRIYAMAAIHESFYKSDKLSEIDLNAYAQKLSRLITQTFIANPENICFDIRIPEISLSIDKANPLGLVLNELISNSLKYAFTDDSKGTIEISAKTKNDEIIELIVSDNGIGMPDDFEWTKVDTLGLRLVKDLVERQLDGSVRYENQDGTRFVITFNLTSDYKS